MFKSQYNIAHILPWSSIGGTEHATLRIAQAVAERGFSSTAFCLSGATSLRDMFEAAGFETASYAAAEPSYRHGAKFLRVSMELASEFRRRKIDLVHCADLLSGQFAAVAGRMANRPVLCHIRNRFEQLSRRDQSFLRTINKFAFVSADTWKHFAYKVSAQRGVVIYDGIDVSETDNCEARRSVRSEFNVADEVKIIGMVARIAPQKDYLTLAKAAARIISADPLVRFLIVGDYSQTETHRVHYEEVQRVLTECNVTSHFIFTDFRRDVARLISAMDIFVLSTHFEGLPLVILEAMARGVPVVATAVDGIPEIVIDNQTGLLHAHKDDAQLAAQLQSLLGDEMHRINLGKSGRQFVLANFTNERFATNMANLYAGMLGLKQLAVQGAPRSEFA